jgi:hypothetical protein
MYVSLTVLSFQNIVPGLIGDLLGEKIILYIVSMSFTYQNHFSLKAN